MAKITCAFCGEASETWTVQEMPKALILECGHKFFGAIGTVPEIEEDTEPELVAYSVEKPSKVIWRLSQQPDADVTDAYARAADNAIKYATAIHVSGRALNLPYGLIIYGKCDYFEKEYVNTTVHEVMHEIIERLESVETSKLFDRLHQASLFGILATFTQNETARSHLIEAYQRGLRPNNPFATLMGLRVRDYELITRILRFGLIEEIGFGTLDDLRKHIEYYNSREF